MKQEKCYIAGMITGLDNHKELFEKAKREVISLGLIPVSPLEINHSENSSWNDFMKEDLKVMLTCENVYVINNYRYSKGAMIEVNLATVLAINVIYQ